MLEKNEQIGIEKRTLLEILKFTLAINLGELGIQIIVTNLPMMITFPNQILIHILILNKLFVANQRHIQHWFGLTFSCILNDQTQ
jgi:hypothetical protein